MARSETTHGFLMKHLLTLILFLGTLSIAAAGGWLPREIHEVRAYVYDYTREEGNRSLLKDGKIHRGVINSGGTKLSDPQIQRLQAALRSSKERKAGAFCYMPHHGFVFFDKNGKAMGHIELCFQCGNVDSSPEGLPMREWNWKAIRELLEELDIPILKEDQDYTKLYRGQSATRAATPRPESIRLPRR
jgi:hypothetical protein